MLEVNKIILADDMGLGKTIQAIGCINADESIRRVLVVSPKSLLPTWQLELASWLVRPLRVATMTSAHTPTAADYDVLLVNYELVTRRRKALDAAGSFDLLICDEAHYLKSPDTQRTRAILGELKVKTRRPAETGLQGECRRLFLLTGTPVLNHPIELYPLLKACDREAQHVHRLVSYFGFRNRYCDPQQTAWGWDFSGVSHAAELRGAIDAGRLLLRRTKQQVLPQLPPKRRQQLPFSDRAVAKREAALLKELAAASASTAALDDDKFGLRGLRGELGLGEVRVGFSDLMKVRHQSALLKVPTAVELVRQAMGHQKVVVFAHHRDVVDGLVSGIGKGLGDGAVVSLTGETPAAAREEAVRRFQSDDEVRVFVGSIRAAGQGITLTSASLVYFVEFDWSPAVMTQAEDRCHRIGQEESLLIQYMYFDGTLDERLAAILNDKQRKIRTFFDPSRGQSTPRAELLEHLAYVRDKAAQAERERQEASDAQEAAGAALGKVEAQLAALQAKREKKREDRERLLVAVAEARRRADAAREAEAAVQQQLSDADEKATTGGARPDPASASAREQPGTAPVERDDDFGDQEVPF